MCIVGIKRLYHRIDRPCSQTILPCWHSTVGIGLVCIWHLFFYTVRKGCEMKWFFFFFSFPRSVLHRQLKPRNVLSLAWSYVHIPDSSFHNLQVRLTFLPLLFLWLVFGKIHVVKSPTPPSPDMFFYKIFWSLIQLLALTSSALWMSRKKKLNRKKPSWCEWQRNNIFQLQYTVPYLP